jgi:hypothetical protein
MRVVTKKNAWGALAERVEINDCTAYAAARRLWQKKKKPNEEIKVKNMFGCRTLSTIFFVHLKWEKKKVDRVRQPNIFFTLISSFGFFFFCHNRRAAAYAVQSLISTRSARAPHAFFFVTTRIVHSSTTLRMFLRRLLWSPPAWKHPPSRAKLIIKTRSMIIIVYHAQI